VVAGTVATDSAIRVRVDAVGEDTALAGIQRLVAQAPASSGRAQVLADRFAALLFYVAAAAAVITFVVWWALGSLDQSVVRTVTVLVIACPHALGWPSRWLIALSTAVSARPKSRSRTAWRSSECAPSTRCYSTRPAERNHLRAGQALLLGHDSRRLKGPTIASRPLSCSDSALSGRRLFTRRSGTRRAQDRVVSEGLRHPSGPAAGVNVCCRAPMLAGRTDTQ
jgi:hypothetical protein